MGLGGAGRPIAFTFVTACQVDPQDPLGISHTFFICIFGTGLTSTGQGVSGRLLC